MPRRRRTARALAPAALVAALAMVGSTALPVAGLLQPSPASSWPSFRADSLNTGAIVQPDFPLFTAVWWNATVGSHVEASPVVAEGYVIVAGRDGVVHAYAAETGRQGWSKKLPDRVAGTPAVDAGRVFVSDVKGGLVALDLRTGTQLASAKAGATMSPVSVHEGKVFLGTEAGEVKAFTAANLDLLWTFKVSDVRTVSKFNNVTKVTTCDAASAHPARAVRTAVAVHDGLAFFGSLNHYVYAIDEGGNSDGTTRVAWSYQTGDIVVSSPVVDHASQQVAFASFDAHLYAFPVQAAGTPDPCFGLVGSPSWTFEMPGDITPSKVAATPAFDGKRYYVGAHNGRIVAVERGGTRAWELPTGGPVLASPAIAGGLVVIGSDDGLLRFVHAGNGSVAKSHALRTPIQAAPALADNSTFVVTEAGALYRLGPPPPPRPDLDIVSVVADGKEVRIVVANVGAAASDPTTIDLTANRTKAVVAVPTVAPGAKVEVKQPLRLGNGTQRLTLVLDPSDTLVESSEDNNRLEDLAFIAPEAAATSEPPAAGKGGLFGLSPIVWFGVGAVLLVAAAGGVFFVLKRRKR